MLYIYDNKKITVAPCSYTLQTIDKSRLRNFSASKNNMIFKATYLSNLGKSDNRLAQVTYYKIHLMVHLKLAESVPGPNPIKAYNTII